MGDHMFGVVTSAGPAGLVVFPKEGKLPKEGVTVQVSSVVGALRGATATDDHNALVVAREAVCDAINAQVLRPNTQSRQQAMIAILQRIDDLLGVE